MCYSASTAGHASPRGLLNWLVGTASQKQTTTGTGQASKPAGVLIHVLNPAQAVDSRKFFALGVLRAIVDGAATNALTKYEDAADEVHDALAAQRMQDHLLESIKDAIMRVPTTGASFVRANWDGILETLNAQHPLNPRITDTHSTLMHAGGMHLHLTSRAKRKRRPNDLEDGGDPFDNLRGPRTDRTHGRLYQHSDTVHRQQFHQAVASMALCLTATEPTTSPWWPVLEHDNKMWIPTHACDLGKQDTRSDHTHYYVSAHDGTDALVTRTSNPQQQQQPPVVYTNTNTNAVLKQSTNLLPTCVARLVQPALAAAHTLRSPNTGTINRVETMLTHADPFLQQGDASATFAAAACKKTDDLTKRTRYFRLTPANEEQYDLIIDFDHPHGWGIGATPCPTTDAVEAVQAYLHQIGQKTA